MAVRIFLKHKIFFLIIMSPIIQNCFSNSIQYQSDIKLEIKKLPNYNNRHHTNSGFKNPYPSPERDTLKAFFWISRKLIFGNEKEKIKPVEGIYISKEDLKQKNSYQFWWIGHSTVYILGPQFALITDPQFSQRASPIDFAGPLRHSLLPIQIQDLPKLDFVLISHNHYDHLDEDSIKTIIKHFNPIFFVPLKVSKILKNWGAQNIIEMDWWEYVQISHLTVYCTPARHFSSRSLFDRNETLWAGWFVKDFKYNISFYFAGDTGYESFFKEIRKEIGKPMLAMIPIGAFEPRWFMQEVHLDPPEAFSAFLDLEADYLFPIHWGTFYLADEPMDLPPKLLKEVAEAHKKNNNLIFLKIGEKKEFFLNLE